MNFQGRDLASTQSLTSSSSLSWRDERQIYASPGACILFSYCLPDFTAIDFPFHSEVGKYKKQKQKHTLNPLPIVFLFTWSFRKTVWSPQVRVCTHSNCGSAFRSCRSNHMLLITCVIVISSLSRVWLCDPMDCSLPGSSVHGILQKRILGMGCHFLPQGIFPTQGSNLHLLRCWWFFTAEPPGKPKYLSACLCVHSQLHMCPCVCLVCLCHYICVWEFVS